MSWSPNWHDNDTAKRYDIERYAAALRLAAARDHESGVAHPNAVAVPHDGVNLRIYTITLTGHFLDAPDISSAWLRAHELAATIVDHTGTPLGAAVAVEPDDGDLNNDTGLWEHPAVIDRPVDLEAVWDDYDAAQSGLAAHTIPRLLNAAADRAIEDWEINQLHTAASNARHHLYPGHPR